MLAGLALVEMQQGSSGPTFRSNPCPLKTKPVFKYLGFSSMDSGLKHAGMTFYLFT
jgi:hypothetical protein